MGYFGLQFLRPVEVHISSNIQYERIFHIHLTSSVDPPHIYCPRVEIQLPFIGTWTCSARRYTTTSSSHKKCHLFPLKKKKEEEDEVEGSTTATRSRRRRGAVIYGHLNSFRMCPDKISILYALRSIGISFSAPHHSCSTVSLS